MFIFEIYQNIFFFIFPIIPFWLSRGKRITPLRVQIVELLAKVHRTVIYSNDDISNWKVMTPICNVNEGNKHKSLASSQMNLFNIFYTSNFSMKLFLSTHCLKALIIFKNDAMKKKFRFKENIGWESKIFISRVILFCMITNIKKKQLVILDNSKRTITLFTYFLLCPKLPFRTFD